MSDLNYTTFTNQIANLMVIPPSDTNFQTMLPGAIDYGEQRIYRELDLLATRVVDRTATFTAANQVMALPTDVGNFLVVERVNVLTPSTATYTTATRVPLVNTSVEFINSVYPSYSASQTTPEFWAMLNNASIIVGPSPDAAYTVEICGTQRPAALSASNSSTILTQMLPDLFVAAAMIFCSAYQRDFSLVGDNPQQGMSWETQYGKLMQSANVEEFRKKYQGPGWTAYTPTPIATPARQ